MGNVLRTGLAWLGDQQAEHMSEPVVYSRGGHSVPLNAVVGRTPFRQTDGAGRSVMRWSEADFVVAAAELVLGGVATKPEPGDTVAWAGGTYAVGAPGGEQCYREIDLGLRLRVHAKRVG